MRLRDALLHPPPSARAGKSFRDWMRELGDGSGPAAHQDGRRVLFFAFAPHWLNVSLAVTVVLVARNCHVDLAFLRSSRIDGRNTAAAFKKFEIHYGRFLRNYRHPRLRCVDLERCQSLQPSEDVMHEARRQSILDSKYILKREEVDVEGNSRHKRIFDFRVSENLNCMTKVASLLGRSAYDVMLTPNGNSCQFGAAFRMARLLDQRAVSFEFGERLGTILISQDMPCTEMDTSKEWKEDAPHVLSANARRRVEELIALREGTDWKGFLYTSQKTRYGSHKEQLAARMKIATGGRRVVLMCPNVAWDSAMLGRDSAFSSLVEWMRQTTTFFARREDCRLIVRVHPAETMIGTDQPMAEIIHETCPALPEHVLIVGPDEPVNTYDLMDLCDFGLVYNSTAGLEMALRGIPTIVAGRPHYAGKGFTLDAPRPREYFGAIEKRLAEPAGARLSPRQTELAWCYADVYFFRWPKPFPWCLGTFWQDLEVWPMRRVLGAEGQSRFGPSFDLLAGRAS